ncbi:MAG: glutamate--tRNA ligase [Candidatus Pacebacteria bacterium]|nr:glutamate--tRNA ligase [Candidatus Paceibacterota bacterium]
MSVITRFAPSPTGYLHIGGARTALFNYLFSKHHGGQFLLRIEDTDRERSTQSAIDAIMTGLDWLQLHHQGEIVLQSRNAPRHAEVANQMLAAGTAYRCFASPEELAEMRAAQVAAKQPQKYDGRWRDRDPSETRAMVAAGKPFVIRLRAEQGGATTIDDRVQGAVKVENSQMDDLVLLRADGSPTYMLSVVVDDHDMAITHVIRGDDHLTNSFRQAQIYRANGWQVPEFAHIPLIHGADGTKLSKRHGAVDLNQWRLDGYLPEAMRNYLLRLGWSHGDSEIISDQQAIEWFSLEAVGRSPSRLDAKKLNSVNGHYINQLSDDDLLARLKPYIDYPLPDPVVARLKMVYCLKKDMNYSAMMGLKQRSKTMIELADLLRVYCCRPTSQTDKARALVATYAAIDHSPAVLQQAMSGYDSATTSPLELVQSLTSLGDKYSEMLRIALSGATVSPPLDDLIFVLGRDEVLARIGGLELLSP